MKSLIIKVLLGPSLVLWNGVLVAGQESEGYSLTEKQSHNKNLESSSDIKDARYRRPNFKRPQFGELDLDGDSFITLSEFKQKPIPHGDHDVVFGHIDADGNGEITLQEFESHKPPPHPKHRMKHSQGKQK